MARRPDPDPLETNDVAIVAGGTALWVIGLVVVLILKAVGTHVHDWWWQMCAAGSLLGLCGIRYCHRRQQRLRG